ncbi:hypothetical protein PR003_g6549 [Phytophthora rubi]|uniref:Uncharacterized protein n=1 Tax=Phytophthora rubi TaxID=129364 RepID=A0A6A4FS39_9STRA|nr:hypothetical protein PR001_g8263 [Phytophthora rubi]KAE9348187.1 hypothetical protein PR003_g6549 [Phytophthora rubi]
MADEEARSLQEAVPVCDRVRCTDWMEPDKALHGSKGLYGRAVDSFPAPFRSSDRRVNMNKARDWWNKREHTAAQLAEPNQLKYSPVPYPGMTGACQRTVCWAHAAYLPGLRWTLSSAVLWHRSEPSTHRFDGARDPPEWYSPWSQVASGYLEGGCQVRVLILCFRPKDGLSRRGPADVTVVSEGVRAELTRSVR